MIRSLRSFLVLGLALVFAGTVLAQEEKKKPTTPPTIKPADKAGAKAPAGAPSEADMAKMMEAWKQAATPGAEHAKLKPLAGNWTVATKWRMTPDDPWGETTGTAQYRWILGDRILVQEVKGNPSPKPDPMMPYPFEGFGLSGYDNVTKQYWSAWTDNMGTGLMTSTGTADGSGKTFTYTGTYNCPIRGEVTAKSVLKIQGDDKVVYEMHDKAPDGKEFMSLEVTYTRKK